MVLSYVALLMYPFSTKRIRALCFTYYMTGYASMICQPPKVPRESGKLGDVHVPKETGLGLSRNQSSDETGTPRLRVRLCIQKNRKKLADAWITEA
jgi:hypothetical protein